MLALFVCVPVSLAFLTDIISPIPVLLLVGAASFVILLRDTTFDRSTLWNIQGLQKALARMIPFWLLSALIIGLAVHLLRPESFLGLPRERPVTWLLVMTLYPIFSVIPQSIIYRAFFTHRYQLFFGNGVMMIFAGAVAFGLAHLIFKEWLAVLLTLGGGALFVARHIEHKSMLAGAIEHAMYGNMAFTLGLGAFFYHGAARISQAGP